MGVFGKVNLREDGKKLEKMRRENFLKGIRLKGGEEKNVVGPGCFILRPTKRFSPQTGEKTEGESVIC